MNDETKTMARAAGACILGVCLLVVGCNSTPKPAPVVVPANVPSTSSAAAAAPAAPRPPVEPVTVLPPAGFQQGIQERIRVLASAPNQRVAPDTVGYYMDVQQARLQQLRGLPVQRAGSRLLITLAGASAFEPGSSTLSGAAEAVLKPLSAILDEYSATVVSVHGHTDDSGPAAANQQLSERRATVVARFLMAQGLRASRLVVVGYGASTPVTSNESPAGREQNRRIELQIDPVTP
jgi:outer membrane protein OmpA-like peptidoglycan-associated protein